METKDIKAVDSGIKATIVAKPIYHVMQMANMINWVYNYFIGLKPTALGKLSEGEFRVKSSQDALNRLFEVKGVGARFMTLWVNKDCSKDSSFRATHSVTGEINKYRVTGAGKNKTQPIHKAFQRFWIEVIVNGFFENAVKNAVVRNDGEKTDWKPLAYRTNGIENVDGSRVICHKLCKGDNEERDYLSYIVFDYLSPVEYVDENGNPLDAEYMSGFFPSKETKDKAKEVQAKKHGLEVEVDPQPRTIRFDNIGKIHFAKQHFEISQ